MAAATAPFSNCRLDPARGGRSGLQLRALTPRLPVTLSYGQRARAGGSGPYANRTTSYASSLLKLPKRTGVVNTAATDSLKATYWYPTKYLAKVEQQKPHKLSTFQIYSHSEKETDAQKQLKLLKSVPKIEQSPKLKTKQSDELSNDSNGIKYMKILDLSLPPIIFSKFKGYSKFMMSTNLV